MFLFKGERNYEYKIGEKFYISYLYLDKHGSCGRGKPEEGRSSNRLNLRSSWAYYSSVQAQHNKDNPDSETKEGSLPEEPKEHTFLGRL